MIYLPFVATRLFPWLLPVSVDRAIRFYLSEVPCGVASPGPWSGTPSNADILWKGI